LGRREILLTGSAITIRLTLVRVYIFQFRCCELDNIDEENQNPFKKAVDLEVIKQKTQPTLTETRDKFRELLCERDYCCAFTGTLAEFSAGIHIIPHRRGAEVC
jgi:hypothetical protein